MDKVVHPDNKILFRAKEGKIGKDEREKKGKKERERTNAKEQM